MFNYAPSPINDHMGLQHMHGPHMGTEWWVGRGHLADSSAWSRPFRWQRFWRTSRVLGPHSALNHAPLHWRDPVMNTSSLLWAVDGQWMHVPAWRVGGVYSPANAQFTTESLLAPGPAAPLTLNADALWQVTADKCDSLKELCQAYVMVEVLRNNSNAVVPGFEAGKCVVAGVDVHEHVLRWGNQTTESIPAQTPIRLRVTMRDAVLYSIGMAVASREAPRTKLDDEQTTEEQTTSVQNRMMPADTRSNECGLFEFAAFVVAAAVAFGLHSRYRLAALESDLSKGAHLTEKTVPPSPRLSSALTISEAVYPTAEAAAADKSLRAGTRVVTLGRLATNDGGDWQYVVSASMIPADGGVAIGMANGLQLRAIHRGCANTLQYGCICDCKTDNAKALQAALNFDGDLIICGHNTYFTGTQLSADVANRRITLVAGCTLAPLGPCDAVIAVNGASGVVIDGRGCIDADHFAKAGVLLRCNGDAARGSPMERCQVHDITVQNTAIDTKLMCGAVQVDNATGAGSHFNLDGVKVCGVTVKDCGSHGVLVAYASNVEIANCRFESCRNHGTEAVGCTWVAIKSNRAIDCGLSAFGVGSQTQHFAIDDNFADGCSGDGAITLEWNSVSGTVSRNILSNCRGSSCINISFGLTKKPDGSWPVPPSSPFATVHDITVSDNVLQGDPTGRSPKSFPGKQRGILAYADVGAPGYNLQIHGNQISSCFLAMDLNYFRHSAISDTTVFSPLSPGNFLAALTWITDSALRGLTCGASVDDHAVQILDVSPGAGASTVRRPSDRLSLSDINADAPGKSVVFLGCGTEFVVSSITTSHAQHFVACGGPSPARCTVGGLAGSAAGAPCEGVTVVPWSRV
eukprot:COSAG04_NODE_2165_length_4644_cov_3.313022_2_plen_861_part_00